MKTKTGNSLKAMDRFNGLFRKQIFIPIAALVILALFNLIVDPSFFKITLGKILQKYLLPFQESAVPRLVNLLLRQSCQSG